MQLELHHAEEEAVRRPAGPVVRLVRANDRAQAARAEEELDRNASVHEAVVNDEVPHREGRHPDANAEREVVAPRLALRPPHDKRARHRRMDEGEEIVPLEGAGLRLVVRAMNAVEGLVPQTAVKQRRPELHQDGNDEGDRDPEGHR